MMHPALSQGIAGRCLVVEHSPDLRANLFAMQKDENMVLRSDKSLLTLCKVIVERAQRGLIRQTLGFRADHWLRAVFLDCRLALG